MRIEYAPNPLYTKIILDEHEREVFRLKIKIDELLERTYSAYHTLTHHDWWNSFIAKDGADRPVRTHADTLKEAADDIMHDYLYGDEDGKPSGLDKRADEMFNYYMADLVGHHVGDCTCVACACSKCHAERIIGVDTILGLGKHEARKIDGAFGRENERSIDEVLEILKGNTPAVWKDTGNPRWTKADHDKHLPRWKAEGEKAYIWLLNYRNTHFKD